MKKIRVNSILVLVITAMLALLFIQAYQTGQLYDRKSSEFKGRFTTTLDRVAMHHEKAEDIRRYMHVVNKDFNLKYKDMLKEEFKTLLSATESISIEDTSIYEDGDMQNYLIIKGKAFDSISGVSTEQRVLTRDVRQLRDLFSKSKVNQDSVKLAVQLDQRVIQQIFKKARFVNDMMLDVFRSNVYQEPNERLDVVFLDSVLETELGQENLPEDYEFVVTDMHGETIDFVKEPKRYNSKIDTTISHKTLLFPSNTLADELYLHVSFPKQKSFLLGEMWIGLAVNLSLVILIIIALMFMFRTILSQKKLSEMKSDFISNMTHEFKTPISTISLACQAMNDADMVNELSSQTQPYVKMISDENKRLSLLVERILQSATLDKGELRVREEEIALNEVVKDIVDHAQFRIESTGGKVSLSLPDESLLVNGDRMHVTNMISNLVDNAIKYSDQSPKVEVTLKREGKRTLISVKDHGIGIKKEHLNKIFDKLYRIPTGNIHNVKGFGLGLSYVKAIAELHGWNVTVKSKLGVGSEFTIVIKE